MGTTIDLITRDGATIAGYRATPDGASKAGIVVVQEIFGLNAHIRSIADRLAALGYTALAPAIFDRAERGVELPYDGEGMKRGVALARGIAQDQHLLSVEAAIDALAAEGPVGVVGFCLGGTLAFAAATKSPRLAAAVGFYGGGIAAMLGTHPPKPLCPVELHFGEHDDHISADDIAKVKGAYPDMPIYTYDAGHGFNCDARGSYDKPSADEAWTRTLAFFKDHLKG